ncbi:MAG: DoxX-like family protein [Flavobacteriales bacterium]|nr:MAG: DoxX-like family protein [Flavobacteriales bacterium]
MNVVRFVQQRAFRYFFALVWLVNGLWCKVLGGVPRHEVIVGAILDRDLAPQFTIAIGIAEIGMAGWIIAGWRYQLCAASQIAIILLMNVIEFFAVPHLLLWGRLNIVFATLLCGLIFWNGFSPRRTAHV